MEFKSYERTTKPVESVELTQEQFDEQILVEAEKLKTNIGQLKSEIDQFGGVEAFKKYFETQHSSNTNNAGTELNRLYSDVESKKDESIKFAKLGTLCVTIAAVVTGAMVYESGSGKGDMADTVLLALPLILSITGVGMFIESIKDKIEARKIKRQKQKEELKFKMTGTEVKSEFE